MELHDTQMKTAEDLSKAVGVPPNVTVYGSNSGDYSSGCKDAATERLNWSGNETPFHLM